MIVRTSRAPAVPVEIARRHAAVLLSRGRELKNTIRNVRKTRRHGARNVKLRRESECIQLNEILNKTEGFREHSHPFRRRRRIIHIDRTFRPLKTIV